MSKKRYIYQYHVLGDGNFPMDMLRHDQCWPAYGCDVDKISSAKKGRRYVKLRSHKEPTEARWKSFGWHVTTSVEKFEI